MKIGYVRVSKQEQHEALQIDALKEAGCEKWFVDKMTGSKAERNGTDRHHHSRRQAHLSLDGSPGRI